MSQPQQEKQPQDELQQQPQKQTQQDLQQGRPFSTTVEAVMQKMSLTHPKDALLLPQLLHWVKTQRPNYMYTTVLSLAVLLQRLARAFSMRSGTGLLKIKAKPPVVVAVVATKAATGQAQAPITAASTSAAASTATDPPATTTTTPVARVEASQSATTATTTPAEKQPTPAASATTTTATDKASPKPKPKPKRKAFRSAKKLDLSPRVVESLKGFVADLAAAIPLILKHAEYEQKLNPQKPGIFVSQRAPTAVAIVDVCLELLEGVVMSDAVLKSGNEDAVGSKQSPNAAMELFRTVLAALTVTANNTSTDDAATPSPSTTTTTTTTTTTAAAAETVAKIKAEAKAAAMDQLKFKTFCVKTLESSQSRTVHLVESFHDFQLLWNIAQHQHSVVFVPRTATHDLQEEVAWKLAIWRVWKHQEEQPNLCSRRARLLVAATSMIVMSLFPFFHRHSEAVVADNTLIKEEKTTTTTTTDAKPKATADVEKETKTETPSTTTTSDMVNDNNKRPLTDISTTKETGDDAATKIRKIALDVKFNIQNKSIAVLEKSATTAPKVDSVPGFPYGHCDKCAKQERTRHIIMHAARQATAFLQWASTTAGGNSGAASSSTPNKTNAGMDLTRAEIDRELLRMTRDLASLSTVPVLESDSWIEILKVAIGMKNNSDDDLTDASAEKNLLSIIDQAFSTMMREDDERMGTRVEAVSYVDEMTLITQASRDHIDHLCEVTTSRQKRRNELIACIPVTSVPTPRRLDEIKEQSQNIMAMQQEQNQQGQQSSSVPIESTAFPVAKQQTPISSNALVDQNRSVSPPVMTEPMELNEWIIAVLSSLTAIGPSSTLVQQLNDAIISSTNEATTSWQNVVVPVLNRFIGRMRDTVGDRGEGATPVEVGPDGVARVTYRTQDTQLWAASIQVYYQALESILTHETKAINATLVLSDEFHEALLACCYLCVARSIIMTGKMQLVNPENHQIYSIMPLTGCTPYTYLKVTESFLRAMTAAKTGEASKVPTVTYGTLPRLLQKEMKNSEVFVIESLLWARDHPNSLAEGYIVRAIADLKLGKQWPPEVLKPTLPEEIDDLDGNIEMEESTEPKHAEASFVAYIMRKLLNISYFRIESICESLGIPREYPVISQIKLAFRFMLRNRIELLYGRHIDQWILTCCYSIGKVMQYAPDLTFARIIDVYVTVRGKDLGERTCQAIVRHVKILDGASEDDSKSYGATNIGNIIRLHNLVFVPTMKHYLLKSKTLRKNKATLKGMIQKAKAMKVERANTVTPNGEASNASDPVLVRQGNVSVQLTLHGGKTSAAGASTDDVPGQSTFLQFGRAGGSNTVALANEMMAQAATPS